MILPPVGAISKHLGVSADPAVKPASHTRAESRGSRRSKVAAGERQTVRWREMDSNFRFRAFLSLRSSSVFSISRSRSAEGTEAESGTEAISLKRKELGGLPIAVGCARSKTGRVPCLHICWAEQCEPDILLYRSPYKCFPLEKTGCNPS